MIKVLIADDSPTTRQFLAHVFASDPEIEVIGTAADGREVLSFLRDHRPDVITMDIQMPEMDGLETTRRIMETDPHPVVIISGLSDREKTATFNAFEAGALAVIMRPHGTGHPDHAESVAEILATVKAMAGVKLVRRWPKGGRPGALAPSAESGVPAPERRPVEIIGIGASTGGPAVLRNILEGLPQSFPLPVVVVQHMSSSFLPGFVEWLGMVTGKKVQLATDGERLAPGVVYIAPGESQMGITPSGKVELDTTVSGEFVRPSVSYLFRTLADSYGSGAAGVLLTGMGRDGADSMRLMKTRGAITIAQNAETCVVNGMPMEAIRLEAVDHILPPEKISALLREIGEKASGNQV